MNHIRKFYFLINFCLVSTFCLAQEIPNEITKNSEKFNLKYFLKFNKLNSRFTYYDYYRYNKDLVLEKNREYIFNKIGIKSSDIINKNDTIYFRETLILKHQIEIYYFIFLKNKYYYFFFKNDSIYEVKDEQIKYQHFKVSQEENFKIDKFKYSLEEFPLCEIFFEFTMGYYIFYNDVNKLIIKKYLPIPGYFSFWHYKLYYLFNPLAP